MKAGGTTGAALIGWQTLLADLSLILFMVTAAAMSASPSRPARAAAPLPKSTGIPALAEPLALWRAGGSQTLEHWLAAEQRDGRQQLTIIVHYRPGAPARALAAAQALVDQTGALGQSARVIVAPAAADEMLASLAYDQAPPAGTAQGLLDPPRLPSARTPP